MKRASELNLSSPCITVRVITSASDILGVMPAAGHQGAHSGWACAQIADLGAQCCRKGAQVQVHAKDPLFRSRPVRSRLALLAPTLSNPRPIPTTPSFGTTHLGLSDNGPRRNGPSALRTSSSPSPLAARIRAVSKPTEPRSAGATMRSSEQLCLRLSSMSSPLGGCIRAAIKTDGTAICWGYDNGQAGVPVS